MALESGMSVFSRRGSSDSSGSVGSALLCVEF